MTDCFLCSKPDIKPETWDLKSLLLIYGSKDRRDNECLKLCQAHLEFCEKRIPELKLEQPKKYVLKKEVEVFMPPIPEKTFKNYQDREPNNGELME